MDRTILAAIAELTDIIAYTNDRRSALEAALFPVGAQLDLLFPPYRVVVLGHCSYDRTVNIGTPDGKWEYWWDVPRLVESLCIEGVTGA